MDLRAVFLWGGLSLALATGAAQADAPFTASFAGPTDRYDHDVLGGIPPYGTLVVTKAGKALTVSLPEDQVFEDIEPRLWDITGDGLPEIVVVESHVRKGARLAVWAFDGTALTRLATTRFIGQRHRWLAPSAAADFDGDGQIEIAYVDRPHLAKELVFVRLSGARLTEVSRAAGFSNHSIGDTTIWAGMRDCGAGPEVLVPNADKTRLMAATPKGAEDLGAFSGAAFKTALACR